MNLGTQEVLNKCWLLLFLTDGFLAWKEEGKTGKESHTCHICEGAQRTLEPGPSSFLVSVKSALQSRQRV